MFITATHEKREDEVFDDQVGRFYECMSIFYDTTVAGLSHE